MKNKQGVMHRLAYIYLEAKGLTPTCDLCEAKDPTCERCQGTGRYFDANKIAKGLSKLYHEANKDPEETARRIKVGAEYFNSKGLDWTPEAVWRRWEDIKKWKEVGSKKDISERRKL